MCAADVPASRPHYWLGLILAVGLALRLWGLSFGLPNVHCRPDESTLVNKALSIAAGELNPHFFNYPSLHLYSLALLYGIFFAFGWVGGFFSGGEDFQRLFFTDPSAFYLIGRTYSAFLGTASVWLVYLIGRHVGGVRAGLFGALFLGVAFLHVRDSHFLTVDVPATFYMLAGYVLLLRYLERPTAGSLLSGAVCFGLAASTKYNLGLFAISVLVALVIAEQGRKGCWSRLAGVTLAMGLAFLAGTPFALLDFSSFWRDLTYERLHFAVGHGDPVIDLGRGWWYHLRFTLPYGLGIPLLAAALAGVGVMAWRRRAADMVVLSGLLLYYGVAGSGKGVFMRYMLPVVPLLCVAAGLVCAMGQRRWGSRWTMLLIVVLVAPTARTVWQYGRLLTQTDTRLLAADWIAAEIPHGSRLAMLGSAFGQPQVRRSREWLQVELEEVRAAGLEGRRLAAMLALEGFPPPPSYYLIELRSTAALASRTVWRRYELAQLRAAGVAWVVTHHHPLTSSSEDVEFLRQLEQQAILVQRFDPFRGSWQKLIYDRLDAFYVPVAGFSMIERPGPAIRIYRLE